MSSSKAVRTWYQRPKVRRIAGWSLLAAIVGVAGLFGYQASQATSALRSGATQAAVLQDQIAGGDVVSAEITLRALQESTSSAHDHTDGLLWDLGSHVPFVGHNVSAVQTVASVLDDVSAEALPPIVEAAGRINAKAFSPRKGKVNLARLSKIAPSIADADEALTSAQAELESIDADSLLIPLRDPVRTIQDKVDTAQAAAHSGEMASALLPSMLGSEGPRSFLLLIQNNAEVRSTGGIPGAFSILKADEGRLSMGAQGSSRDLLPRDEPVLEATRGEKAVYGSTLLTDIRDVTLTPDFPRSGEIAAALAEDELGGTVDGVISVDPVALSYVLAGTGPVRLSNGAVLTSDNVVDALLNRVYTTFPAPGDQDDFFELASREIFDQVKDGTGDPRVVLSGLVKATSEGRLQVWSAHSEEQARLRPSRLSGTLTGDAGNTPEVGLYLNDGASTKMEYYLDFDTIVRSTRCTDNGAQEIATSTRLMSSAPRGLPRSVTGRGEFGPRGTMILNVRLYSPFDGFFTSVDVDGTPQTVYADRHKGRNVTRITVSVEPGATHVITTTMTSGENQKGDLVFATTPGVQTTRNFVTVDSAC